MRWQAAIKLMLWTALVTAILTSLYWITTYDLLDRPATATTGGSAWRPEGVADRRTDLAISIPVQGIKPSGLINSWDQSRAEGRLHRAIDIPAPVGTPVLAAMDGRIEKLFNSDRGGLTIYQRVDEGRLMLYYAHLQGYRRGLAEGQEVRRGQVLATVGASGNANPAFPHLHFQILATTPNSPWNAGEPINPYPLLAGKSARH